MTHTQAKTDKFNNHKTQRQRQRQRKRKRQRQREKHKQSKRSVNKARHATKREVNAREQVNIRIMHKQGMARGPDGGREEREGEGERESPVWQTKLKCN